MRVYLVHNSYREAGGEDGVFEAERRLLEREGHEVFTYVAHNDDVASMSTGALAVSTVWNARSHRELTRRFRDARPDVVHVHNTLPLISPAVYYAARSQGAAVVQTLHNYRLICPAATLFRDGHVCELCVGKPVPWPGVQHACYRGSRAATGAVAAMLAMHRAVGTYRRAVHRYVALTEFARSKLVQGGLPADRIAVKPNFLDADPGAGSGDGGHALFVGRLAPEKGILTLLDAHARAHDAPPLRIVGDGPSLGEVRDRAAGRERVTVLGRLPADRVADEMKRAAVLILPSEWYEGLPMVAIEAFAAGTPVIASRLGAMAEVVDDGRTGWSFEPGDAADLARTLERAATETTSLARMRTAARSEFLATYTAERNHDLLLGVYREAQASARADARGPARGGAP